jgi:hypothetical protein
MHVGRQERLLQMLCKMLDCVATFSFRVDEGNLLTNFQEPVALCLGSEAHIAPGPVEQVAAVVCHGVPLTCG